jgi:hypothetical protein
MNACCSTQPSHVYIVNLFLAPLISDNWWAVIQKLGLCRSGTSPVFTLLSVVQCATCVGTHEEHGPTWPERAPPKGRVNKSRN